MEISLTEQEAEDLARATATARRVRQWRRYRAIQSKPHLPRQPIHKLLWPSRSRQWMQILRS